MPPRRPTPARSSTSLPSLATILATAAVAEGCAPVECGGERIDELAAHGPRGAEALGRWNVSQGLREVAVAVGAIRHDTHVPSVSVGGAPPPVTQTPVPPPQIQPPGGIGAVAPAPVAVDAPSEGSVRVVTPAPQPPPPQPHVSPPHVNATRGDVRRVTPTPRD